GGRLRPEEPGAHVVVDAHDVEAQAGEVPDRLGPDETGRTGDDDDTHAVTPSVLGGRGRQWSIALQCSGSPFQFPHLPPYRAQPAHADAELAGQFGPADVGVGGLDRL